MPAQVCVQQQKEIHKVNALSYTACVSHCVCITRTVYTDSESIPLLAAMHRVWPF